MGKPTICIGENKGADLLRGNREADQHLYFCYSDITIPPLLRSEISSFWPASVIVQPDLCRTRSETTLLVFPRSSSHKLKPKTQASHGLFVPLYSLGNEYGSSVTEDTESR